MATRKNSQNSGSISRTLRFQVLRRDNHACRYCGQGAPDVKLTVDHVVPVALGGNDEPKNLVTACTACNSGKSATPPDAAVVEDVAMRALRWAKAMDAAAEMRHAEMAERDEDRQEFRDLWESWTYAGPNGKQAIELPNCWPVTVDQLIGAGLSSIDLVDAIDIAMRTEGVKDRFKYFCGVSWRIVSSLQERAAELIEHEEEGQPGPDASPLPEPPPASAQEQGAPSAAYWPPVPRPFVDMKLAWEASRALGITYKHSYPGAEEVLIAVEREVIKVACPHCKAEPGTKCRYQGGTVGASHLHRYKLTIITARMFPPGHLMRADASEAIAELYVGGLA